MAISLEKTDNPTMHLDEQRFQKLCDAVRKQQIENFGGEEAYLEVCSWLSKHRNVEVPETNAHKADVSNAEAQKAEANANAQKANAQEQAQKAETADNTHHLVKKLCLYFDKHKDNMKLCFDIPDDEWGLGLKSLFSSFPNDDEDDFIAASFGKKGEMFEVSIEKQGENLVFQMRATCSKTKESRRLVLNNRGFSYTTDFSEKLDTDAGDGPRPETAS